MFKPDQPIRSYKDDILGRSTFAKSLGDAILSYREKDSIVIGLYGAWGSGKTSIINMALEHVENKSEETNKNKPIVLRFNPWNYSDQNRLIAQFFEQLSIALERPDHAENAKKAGEKLQTYANFFKPLALIPTIGPIASQVSEILKNVGEASKGWGELKANDLSTTKAELNKLLSEQPHKIIVVVDDIDRLNNTEIRQVFQLVKSLGDFSNTIYLLAFDKNVVIKALEKVQEGSGIEYLEKIVQIPFEIPVISKQEVEGLLFSQLGELIKDTPEDKWDQTYWGNIYFSGLQYFFKTIRDVTRYINSLRFSLGIVKGEVNIIDFLAITAVQVFTPEVYYGIRDNKDIFSGIFESTIYGTRNNAEIEQAKKRCDEIVARQNKLSPEALRDFLKRLFPKLESMYGGISYDHSSLGKWSRDCRICSPDFFDTFFRLSVPKGEMSQKEIETILSLGNNLDSFSEALLRLNEDGRIIRFLERLEDYIRDYIPEENIEPIITVLMDIGDLFPEGDLGFFKINTPTRLLRLFYQLSHRLNSHERRFNVYQRAMEKATRSLYTIVNEVSSQDVDHGKYNSGSTPKPEEKLTVNAEQLVELEKLACSKIENWAEDGRLAKHKHLSAILFAWND